MADQRLIDATALTAQFDDAATDHAHVGNRIDAACYRHAARLIREAPTVVPAAPVDRERLLDAMAAVRAHLLGGMVVTPLAYDRQRAAGLLSGDPSESPTDQAMLAVARALGWEPPGGAR